MKSNAIVKRTNDFVNQLSTEIYDRPAVKFVREFLTGMFAAQSTVVTDIVRSLSSNNADFKKNYKRINRRLGEVDFLPAKMQQQERAFREITDETVIAIDIGDITKPYSTSLECLGKVADGSDDHKIKPGYWLLGAVAVNPSSEDKTPQPLELKMYSSEAESFYSENTVVKNLISELSVKTKGRGIYTIDRGGDRSVLLKHMIELNLKFVVRLKDRCLTLENTEKMRVGKHRQVKRGKLAYEASIKRESANKRKRSTMNIRYDFEKVQITNLVKKADHQCYLVTAWSDKHLRPIELLTSQPINSPEDALQVILNYLSRWSVEETYRFLKANAGLEEMRCFSYFKLQNLTNACFIVASIIARMAMYSSWRSLFKRTALRLKDSPAKLYNWFYRAADACAVLIRRWMGEILHENKPKFHARKTGPYQPSLFSVEHDL